VSLAVARFFGGVNFLPGKVAGGTFQSALGSLPLPFDHADGPGILTIRPEALRLGPGPAAMTATVADNSFLGTQSRVGVTIAGIRLEALVAPETARPMAPGASVGVTLPPEALWVLPPDQAGVSPDNSTA
jgi:ABC-type Fe3+/spermidine/putrescine transport system ATPase subunit